MGSRRRPAKWLVLALGAALLGLGLPAAPTAAAAAPLSVKAADLDVPVGAEPDGAAVSLDASVFTPSDGGQHPAVLLGHGFGGSKEDLVERARSLAARGYVVLTWTARGFGTSGGRIHLDDPAYESLFAEAESLGVPLYLHPTTPHPAVMDAWFAPYVDQGLHLASWGFAVEAGTHALRLIYSGLFDRHPKLQMILGHLGEMLPFTAFRTDHYYGLGGYGGNLKKLPSQYLKENFYFTTSGNFSPPAMACTLDVMGADRVMFSVYYPMDDNLYGATFLASYPMDDTDRHKVGYENAVRLFGNRIPDPSRQSANT